MNQAVYTVRLETDFGNLRMTVNPQTDVFEVFKKKIVETFEQQMKSFGIKAGELKYMIQQETGEIPLSVLETTPISKIPKIQNMVTIKVSCIQKLVAPKPKEQDVPVIPQLKKRSSLCNHPPDSKVQCINCLNKQLIQESKIVQPAPKVNPNLPLAPQIKPGCSHGEHAQCPNCMNDVKLTIEEQQIEQKKKCTHDEKGQCLNCINPNEIDKQMLCFHNQNSKCPNCVDDDYIKGKHVSFDYYLTDQRNKCKGQHGDDSMCNSCTPPVEIRYKHNRACPGNHPPFPQGSCNKCQPQPIVISTQQYRHVDYLEFMNRDEVKNFVGYWYNNEQKSQMRVGFLYGYYAEDPNYQEGIRAVAEYIYEPPQKNHFNDFQILEDPENDYYVDEISNAMGMQRLGWVFTSITNDCFLTAQELIAAAKFQCENRVEHPCQYPVSQFVTLVMRDGMGIKQDEILPEVYMTSDQAEALYLSEIYENQTERSSKVKFKAPYRDPEGLQDEIPSVQFQNQEVDEIDTATLIVSLGNGINKNAAAFSYIKNNDFPVENRDTTPKDFQKMLETVKVYLFMKFGNKQPHIKYANFHLLLFLARENMIGLENVIPIARHVGNPDRHPFPEASEELIKQKIRGVIGGI